ncbi:MAG: YeeE/YedE thiosulfate transporter family protein, partial [Chloroflexota bacterium]
MNFPLTSLQTTSAANPWSYLVFLVIGFAFGYVLEISGFGNSKKLAAQFYFTDLTVLKVMFGAIITAMVLLFTMIGLGVLDYSQVYVNTTYLWPMIVGGLIMGVGFIVGGFCPGTSLVGMVTGKVDGLFFVLGVLTGIFAFGETEIYFDYWWQNSGYLGRFTIMDWLNLPNGVVVTLVVLMALFMFFGAELLEKYVGKRDLAKEPKMRFAGAAALIAVALSVIFIGSPSTEQKYTQLAPVKDTALAKREVQIVPAELFHTMYDNKLQLVILDIRSEADYNLFHLRGARNVQPKEVK